MLGRYTTGPRERRWRSIAGALSHLRSAPGHRGPGELPPHAGLHWACAGSERRDGHDARWPPAGVHGVHNGKPVLCFHGTPGSRLWCPYEGATSAAHVRLILPDRPGFGRSDPLEGRTYGDELELSALFRTPFLHCLTSFGPVVLRLVMTQRLPRTWQWSSLPPTSTPSTSIRSSSISGSRLPKAIDGSSKTLAYTVVRRVHPRDVAARTRCDQMGADRRVPKPWRFRLADISIPVSIWHGSQDPRVTQEQIDFQASTIPNSSVVIWPDSGHLGFVKH